MTESTFNENLVSAMSVVDGKVEISNDLIENHIKEYGSTLADIKAAQSVIGKVVHDVSTAAGKVAVDHMAKEKDAASVAVQFNVGKQSTKMDIKRSHEIRVSVSDPSKGTREVKGWTSASTNSGIGDTARRNIRKEIADYAETKLK